MPRFGRRYRKGKSYTTAVIHVPSTMGGSLASNAAVLHVIESPSIFAAGSASSNIEAQDKDRTVNVGHKIGRITIDYGISNAQGDGVLEFCILKTLRSDSTPTLGTHPIPSAAEILAQGMQQACRLANPGLVFYYGKATFTREFTRTKHIMLSPAKYKQSLVKAGDHWVMLVFNRSTAATIVNDFECRYKEFG